MHSKRIGLPINCNYKRVGHPSEPVFWCEGMIYSNIKVNAGATLFFFKTCLRRLKSIIIHVLYNNRQYNSKHSYAFYASTVQIYITQSVTIAISKIPFQVGTNWLSKLIASGKL